MRHATMKACAERYARDEMGWPDAEAVDARPAGRDDRSVAVLVDPDDDGGRPFVVAFDEADRIATDAGDPADFGFEGV